MVSKENYEIWMMDYLDGTLSDTDEATLMQFLEENPELKEELNGLDNTILKPTETPFNLKSNLLKTSAQAYEMDYPEYVAVKELEEELSADEQAWKSSYLKKNKKHNRLFSLYSKTILKADYNIKYQLKGNLKRVVIIPMLKVNTLRKLSAAATIAILLSLGAMPFLKKSANNIQTIVVNDTPSLITMPTSTPKTIKKSTIKPVILKQKTNRVPDKKKKPEATTVQQKGFDKVIIMPISKKEIHPFEVKHVNAYEIGLNAMMPIIIANNLAKQEQNYLAMQSYVNEESQRLTRSARAIASGVKVINFLSGNETKMKQILNQDGQMIAYQVESDNIYIQQKIKN